MKKISLSLLFIGLSWGIFASNLLTKIKGKTRLIELNKYWKGQEATILFNQFPKNEKEWIQLHLNLVNEILSSKNIDHLNHSQKQNRTFLLKKLKAYELNGVFPINRYHSERTPYFIDNASTACAVGQLIIESGNKQLAHTISEHFNYQYIEDMPQEQISTWAFEHGFTVDELMWIQPSYGPQCPLDSAIPSTCPSNIGCLNVDWYKTNLDSATLKLDAVERNIGFGWSIDTLFFNTYAQGFTPYGLYRFALSDSLSNKDTIYYDLMGPTPFVLEDSILQTSSQCLNKLTLSAQNGTPPYRFRLYTLPMYNVIYPKNGIFDSICPGQYSAWMIDSNFCSYSKLITIGGSTTSSLKLKIEDKVLLRLVNPLQNNQLNLRTTLEGIKTIQIFNLSGKLIQEFQTNN